MSEELLQRDLIKNPPKIGKWDFYNIGSTTIKALKGFGIIRNVDYGDAELKKLDALITQQKNVIAVIEYKKPTEFRTEQQKQKAIDQEIEVARKLDCKIIIATDTQETIWVNALTGERITDFEGSEVNFNFDPQSEEIVELIEKINDSINEQNNAIKPRKLVNPTDLAKSIWQDVWAVSGATPENCLYTFVELFIFKYLSDLGVLKSPQNFDFLWDLYSSDREDVDEFALEYYAGNIRPKIKQLFPESPSDKTTIINGTIFVSKDQKAVKGYSTTFRTVLEKFKKYGKLEYIDYDFKSQLFESFLKESISKKNWGQFFTPLKVVRAVAEMAKDDIKPGISICDPASGVGKFLLEPIATQITKLYDVNGDDIVPKITIHGYDKGFDHDEQKTIILAKANMLIYFSDLIKENPSLTKKFADLFNDSFILKTNSILGTLSDPAENQYDLILTNPPYVTSGSGNLKDEIRKDGDLVNYYKTNAMGVEGLFMEWIIKALKPGGKAFIVIPDGLLNRQNDKNIRQFILDECYLDGIISLPLNTFFTTNKKTYVLCVTKKTNKKDKQVDPVFTYLVSEIGETRDIYRFEIDQNDLNEAATLYSFFKANKTSFSKINNDLRCKVQPIEKFTQEINKSWLVDNWWSNEEKITLGMIDRKETVSLLEFASVIQDVAGSMQEFQEEVQELSVEIEKKKIITQKEFLLSEVFDIKKGLSRYTKTYGNTHKGEHPVYSASNVAPLTSIDTFDYDGDYLTWATNGFAGYIKIISGKFSINGDRGLLVPKISNVNIKYIKHQLEPTLRAMAKGRKGEKGEDEFTKVYPSMLADIAISLPVDENDNIDAEAQTELVAKITALEEMRARVVEHKRTVGTANVDVTKGVPMKTFAIGDIFDFPQTNSKITRRFSLANKGDIPVYASSKDEKSTLGSIKDNLPGIHYYEDCLSWNRNGSVGYVFIREGRFTTNEDHRAMVIKEEFANRLDKSYLKYEIEAKLFSEGFSFLNKCGVDKIKRVQIDIPVVNDDISLDAQKLMARQFNKVDSIKEEINRELDKLLVVPVEL